MAKKTKIAIIGTVGLPAKYGGFETLTENLVSYNGRQNEGVDITVYCSSRAYENYPSVYQNARLRFIPLDANGVQSIPYDIWSILDAYVRKSDVILLLGTSGAFVLPLIRAFGRTRILTNIDGLEWRRDKWRGVARFVLKTLERIAVRFSNVVIADNAAIGEYLEKEYAVDHAIIPYGGDHALEALADETAVAGLPERYALALCRIEPENNVAIILEAFDGLDTPLVFVGNWDKSDYGRHLKARYKDHPTITIHDPVYEPRGLRAIRDRASIYVHGHSAGGTNPSLVEMMHFSIPVLAHGCAFNRHTTEEKARYFMIAAELAEAVDALTPQAAARIGADMSEIARRHYTWDQIGRAYFELLESRRGH